MSERETKNDETTESVADLPVSPEQTKEVQGGGLANPFPGFTGGTRVAVGDLD